MTDNNTKVDKNENTTGKQKDILAGFFPCPLCNLGLEIRLSKNKKPYCVCNFCGLQLFIRGKKGIKQLKEFLESDLIEKVDNNKTIPINEFSLGINKSKKVLIILNEIELLENTIKEIGNSLTFWESVFGSEQKEKVLSVLNGDLEKLKKELELT